jgi:hypothetical protein
MHRQNRIPAVQGDLEVRPFARHEGCSLICQPALELAALHNYKYKQNCLYLQSVCGAQANGSGWTCDRTRKHTEPSPPNPERSGTPLSNSIKKSVNKMDLAGMCIQRIFTLEHGPFALPSAAADGMADKTYLVRFKPVELGALVVVAESAQIYDDHLVFLNSKGKVAGLFLLEAVESWSEVTD